MKILSFDTSCGKCSVAISDDARVISTEIAREQSVQAERLIPLIENALSKANLRYEDIDYLAVTTGPGSFTGIRIALATASSIAVASNIRPIAISNFEVVHQRTREAVKNFDYSIVVFNAYREQLYIQVFDQHKSALGPDLIDTKAFGQYIKDLRGIVVASGTGTMQVIDSLKNMIILPRFQTPDARTMCRLAYSHICAGNINQDLTPLYIRPPDAKIAVTDNKPNALSLKFIM